MNARAMPHSMHWAEAYIGAPYVAGEADCGRLVCRVANEVFGIATPSHAEAERALSAAGRSRQIVDVLAEYAAPVAEPAEGDIVLMYCRARPSHVGVYCVVDGEPAVLHAIAKPGQSVLGKLRELSRIYLTVEGFYRWK